MQDHSEARRVFGEHRQRPLGRVPGVDDHRQSGPPGEVQVIDEGVLLDVVRPVVVEEIEAGRPHAHHLRVLHQVLQRGPALVVQQPGLLGMETHGGEHLRKALGHGDGFPGTLQVDAGLDDQFHPCALSVGDERRGVILAVVEMGVGVDEHIRVGGKGTSRP